MDFLDSLPPGAVVILLICYGIISGLIGNAAAKRQDAQTRSWRNLVESQAKGLEDMQTRIDALQGDVLECERARAADRREHEHEQVQMREKHAREIGELQGQITTLRHMLRGD